MGKQSSPATPDYSSIAASNESAANKQYQLGEQQLDWGKQQFNEIWPYAQSYLQQQTKSSAEETANAEKAQSFYESTYKPIESDFANKAMNYDTAANDSQRAGSAMADVATTFDANRAASLSNLESYGIDPSQTRYSALDLGTRISQAAATAAAGTQSRLNSEATGLALEGEAINTGRGYASNVANAYNTASNSGSSGVNTANSTTTTGANSMGSPTSYYAGGNSANQGATSALNTGYSNALAGSQFQAGQSSAFSSGVGSLLGTAAMAAAIAF